MYPPEIDDVCDYDFYCYDDEIANQYIVVYQTEGVVDKKIFTLFEFYTFEDMDNVFAKALDFAKTHDTLLFYQEYCTEFYNPKTGEPVETPIDSVYVKHYYDQPIQPYQTNEFISIDTDELPF